MMRDDPIWDHPPRSKPPLDPDQLIYGRRAADNSSELPQLLIEEPAENECDIPCRQYVVPGYLQRGVLIELVGPGGAGKGQLATAWAVAVALGRQFGNFKPDGAMRVLLFSAEDDIAEQNRRVAAMLRWY